MIPLLTTLGELLRAAPTLSGNGWLFVSVETRPIALESRCAVLDLNAEHDPDNPPFAAEQGLIRLLDMGTVKQIVNNARQQVPLSGQVPQDVLLQALAFHYRHDAFIDLSARSA